MPYEVQHAGYTLSDDPARLDIDGVHAFLSRCYWSEGIPRAIVAQALANSVCLGIYAPDGAQVGLLRVVTDSTTYAYLCDVYVLEPHRRRGLAEAGMRALLAHPRLQNLRRWQLVTRDAHPLYAKFGFTALKAPERHMERHDPDVYRR